MNRFIFKKHLLAIALLLLCGVSAQAADDDLITQQITIKLDKAGTLPDRIGSSKKYKITNLKIIGEINGTDLRLIRDMAGHDVEGDSTAGKLTSLDLADAQIVSGGGKYYNPDFSTNCYCYTAKDKLGDCTFYKCSKLKYLIIPSSVTSIGDYAFDGCIGLTSCNIPSSVTSIGDHAFDGCIGLTSCNIPSSVTSIGDHAFFLCRNITSVVIPFGVGFISYRAFAGCFNLTNIVIPSSVTLIDMGAFEACGLKSIYIPTSVKYIGDGAFKNCSKLTSIYISAEIPASTTNSTFEGVDKDKCILYVPQGTYQDYWLAEGWGDFKNIVEYDATKVGNSVVDKEIKEVARYTANGQRLDTPTKGLNIVRYSDGSVRKELHN